MIISYVWSAAFLQGIRFADFKGGEEEWNTLYDIWRKVQFQLKGIMLLSLGYQDDCNRKNL